MQNLNVTGSENICEKGHTVGMVQLDTLIDDSLMDYLKMKDLLVQLSSQLENNATEKAADLLTKFNSLSKETRKSDSRLIKNFKTAAASENISEKLIELRALQEEVVSLIQKTVLRANSIKSLLANEFLSIKTGRKAMTGYKSKSDSHGRIVNRSS